MSKPVACDIFIRRNGKTIFILDDEFPDYLSPDINPTGISLLDDEDFGENESHYDEDDEQF